MNRGGLTIREIRRRADISQAGLAKLLATSQAAVWRWETGRVEPPWSTVHRAADVCGMALAVHAEAVDPDEWRLAEASLRRTPAERLAELERYSRFVTAGRRALRTRGQR